MGLPAARAPLEASSRSKSARRRACSPAAVAPVKLTLGSGATAAPGERGPSWSSNELGSTLGASQPVRRPEVRPRSSTSATATPPLALISSAQDPATPSAMPLLTPSARSLRSFQQCPRRPLRQQHTWRPVRYRCAHQRVWKCTGSLRNHGRGSFSSTPAETLAPLCSGARRLPRCSSCSTRRLHGIRKVGDGARGFR